MRLVDTHAHLDLPVFDDDRAAALDRAAAAGVVAVLIPAIRPRTWGRVVAAARAGRGVAVALGVHPQAVPELDAGERALATDADALAAAIAARGPVCAVGECGLDGGAGEPDLQEAILRAHVRAARALGLPLSLHVLRAHDAAPRILREERAVEVGGVLHSYSGSPELVGVYARLGLAFSFAGPVTRATARRPLAAARAVPAELLLAETDAPDQPPEGHRGRTEPALVAGVVAALARARGATAAELAALTTANAARVLPGLVYNEGP